MKNNTKTNGTLQICIMAGIITVYFFAYFQRIAVPGTIFDELQAAFKTSAGTVTTLSVIFFYIYGGVQLFVGSWIDRVGVYKVLLVGGVTLCAGSLITPAANSMLLLQIGRALIAFGASLNYICAVKCLDALFSDHLFPILLGVTISIAYAGGLTGTLPFAVLSEKYGWRPVLWIVGILTTVAFIFTAILFGRVKNQNQNEPYSRGLGSILVVLKNRESRPVILVGAINFSVYFFFQATLGKKMLHDIYHLSSAVAAAFPCIMMVVSIACMSLSGVISRAIGEKRKPIVVLASGAMIIGGLLLLLSVKYEFSYIWVLIGFCLLGFTSLGSVMNGSLMKETNPPEILGTAIGLSNGACYISAAIFTSIAGFIMEQFSGNVVIRNGATAYPRSTYMLIIVLGVILLMYSFYLSCRIRETYGSQIYNKNDHAQDNADIRISYTRSQDNQ